MIGELLAFMSLGAGGYALQKKNKDFQKNSTINRADVPANFGAYDQRQLAGANDAVASKAQQSFGKYLQFPEQNVVGRDRENPGPVYYSDLAGVEMRDFTHNNMQPFFGSRVTQNMDPGANRTVLENYTGAAGLRTNKQEVPYMFAPTRENIYGSRVVSDFLQSRVVPPISRNMEVPVPRVMVGPGIGLGYHDNPTGGFQQYDVQDIARAAYKSVDDLRVATNPKVTYSVPVRAGQMGNERGALPNMAQNRDVFRYHENDTDAMLPISAPFRRDPETGCLVVKQTYRGGSDTEYFAPGGIINKAGEITGETTKQDQCSLSYPSRLPSNAVQNRAAGHNDDYGRDAYQVPTTTKDYFVNAEGRDGVFATAIKAFVAPVLDALRPTKAEFFVQNHRDSGVMAPAIPAKLQVGAGDEPRVTMKETAIHDAEAGNFRGSTKISVLPSDDARVTRKETNIHESHEGFLDSGARCVAVYDPREVAKRTKRETMDPETHVVNLSTGHKKGSAASRYKSKVTVKETTIDLDWQGIVAGQARRGVTTEKYDARLTNRETTCQHDHLGVGAEGGMPGAYITTGQDAPATSRQFLTDERVGPGVSEFKRPVIEGAVETNDAREIVMTEGGARFGPSGPKNALQASDVNVSRVVDRSVATDRGSVGRVIDAGPIITDTHVKGRKVYFEDQLDQLNPTNLRVQLQDNPYVLRSLIP